MLIIYQFPQDTYPMKNMKVSGEDIFQRQGHKERQKEQERQEHEQHHCQHDQQLCWFWCVAKYLWKNEAHMKTESHDEDSILLGQDAA